MLSDGVAERRAVTLGGTMGDSRQVLAGVSAGDRVIVEAPANLQDGGLRSQCGTTTRRGRA